MLSEPSMKRSAALFALVFGVSLAGVPVVQSPVTVVVTDVLVALLLLYSVFRWRVTLGPVGMATILLAVMILLSGIVNMWLDMDFNTANFSANYARVIGLVAMVLLLPRLFRTMGHRDLAIAVLRVLLLHSVLVVLDSFSWLPAPFSLGDPLAGRPSGLFVEPGHFGIYLGLSLSYALQVERNLNCKLVRGLDLALSGLAVVACAGGRGLFMLAYVLFAFTITAGRNVRARTRMVSGIAVTVAVLAISSTMLPETGLSWSLQYLTERVPHFRPTALEDSSARVRVIGGGLFMWKTLREAPFLGGGMGGSNLERSSLVYDYELHAFDYDKALSVRSSPHDMITVVAQAAGLPGVLLLLFVIARLVAVPASRWFGLAIFLSVFMWGAAFESSTWWNIALASSLAGQNALPTRLRSPAGDLAFWLSPGRREPMRRPLQLP